MAAALKVSVVIPAYNRQVELGQALRSLLGEEHLIHEVIVVDDASPSPVAIAPPEALKSRTHLVRLDHNLGSSGARQAGVDRATGDLIAFLDSDDIWLPGKLAAQLPLFDAGEDLIAVATGWQTADMDRSELSTCVPVPAGDPLTFASGCWFCPGSTVVVRRTAFVTVGAMDRSLRRLEDYDWFLRFALAGGRLLVVPVIGAVIRRASKSNRANVVAAARIIRARGDGLPGADAQTRRHLRAWLDVEMAKANWTERRVFAAGLLMLRSLIQVPRTGIQLRRWWRISPPVLSRQQVCELLGLADWPVGTWWRRWLAALPG